MRTWKSFVTAGGLALGLLALAPPAAAQDVEARPGVGLSVFAGLGSGPSSAGTWGFGADAAVHPRVALEVEFARWGSGFAASCVQMWPDSYRCDVAGTSMLAGVALLAPPVGRLHPFAEVLGGRFSRELEDVTYASPALGLGLGVDIPVASTVGFRVGARYLRPFDDDYADLLGEELRFGVGTVAFRYAFGGAR